MCYIRARKQIDPDLSLVTLGYLSLPFMVSVITCTGIAYFSRSSRIPISTAEYNTFFVFGKSNMFICIVSQQYLADPG